MQIPEWMISEEMKNTEHYRMYAEVFGLDVPLTQSQLTESTQGTYRTPSAPRSPNPKTETAESSAPKQSTVIHFRLPERRSTLEEEEQEGRENVELVNKHLASIEIEKMVEGLENVIDDNLTPRNDEPNIPGTRLEPKSDNESPEVEITNDEEMEITNVVIPINVNEEEEEITDEVYELKRREKGKIVEISSQIQKAIDNHIPSQVDVSARSYMSGHILHVHLVQSQTTSVPEQQYQLYLSMKADPQLQQQDIAIWLALQMKVHRTDDDEIPTKQVSQDIMEEISLTINEAKLKKMVDEILRQRCTLGDKHRYHIDQMKNFLKSDIVWESRKEIHVLSQFHERPHTTTNSKLSKNLENPHAKIFYIRKQKEPGKSKEVIYSNSKIIQVISNVLGIGSMTQFTTKIVAKKANECIVSIPSLNNKNLNKNDIEDMYLLIMNGKVPNYLETRLLWSLSVFIRSSVIWEKVHEFQLGIKSYQQKVNLTAPTISFPGVKKHKNVLHHL
ncbi:hypothetical protein Tco_0792205 [Tanacetum coccineum]